MIHSHAALRLLFGALCVAIGCSQPQAPGAAGGRVLIVGLDGATNKVIDPLVEGGQLPTLARLQSEGARSALRPGLPVLSPRIWTTIATGEPPERHGVEDWVKLGAAGGLRLYSNSDRRRPALWNILSARDLRVGVVNWLMTQPPDVVNGVMISDHAVPGMTASRLPMARDIAATRFGASARGKQVHAPEVATVYAHPAEWVERAAAQRDAQAPLTDQPNPFLGDAWQGHPVFDFLRGVYRDDELTVRTALAVEAEIHPDLMMVYLPGVDRISHLLWQGIELPARPPRGATIQPAQVRARHRRALHAYYRFTDALLEELLASYGPEDLVMVISDHGFEASELEYTMPGVHDSEGARNGILYLRGPGVPKGESVDVLRAVDVAPTTLAWLGIGLAENFAGRPAPFLERGSAAAESVPDYDDIPMERVATPASDVEDDIIEKLRTLGYVD